MPFARSSGKRMSARWSIRTSIPDELADNRGTIPSHRFEGKPLHEQLMTARAQRLAEVRIAFERGNGLGKLLGITFRAMRYRMERLGIK